MNARTDLALLYNDQSVLENHHASTSWKILSQTEYNIFSELTVEDEKVNTVMDGLLLIPLLIDYGFIFFVIARNCGN